MDDLIINNILDSMSDSLVVLGQNGDILYTNEATRDILGYTFDDFREKGLGLLFFLNEENYDFNQIFVEAVLNKSINSYTEVDYHHPDGSVKRLAATTSYFLAQGEHETAFIGFVALFKDITEVFNLRRKEKELIQEKERIAREKIRSLHKLAMGVAHELRNPMVTIGGFAARIFKDRDTCEQLKRYAQNILEEARKLEQVVDEIQAYCDLPEIKPCEGEIIAVVNDAVSDLVFRKDNRTIPVTVHNLLPDGHRIVFDPVLIKAVLVRILENAVDFSQDGSSVDVYLYTKGDCTVLEVKDTGIGIDDQDKEFIFNPFFSTRTHGAGMGLAIAERIVREHMGKIEVDSRKGAGTIVRISLPMARSADHVIAQALNTTYE